MGDTATDPLPDDWELQDAIGSYFEAMRAIGEDVLAGRRELPVMFLPCRKDGRS
jgi:hypothetical protein